MKSWSAFVGSRGRRGLAALAVVGAVALGGGGCKKGAEDGAPGEGALVDADEADGGEPAAVEEVAAAPVKKDKSLFGLPLRTLDGQETTLAPYRGQVLLIVNTASDCGYTPQYAGLQKLYDRYRERGFVVLGFPSDDFKKEPAPEADIRQFVTETFGLTFPMFAKTHVIGEDRAPLYTRLAKHDPDPERREIHWNFTKYLLSRRGRVITRFEPQVDPLSDEVVKAVEKALAD